MAGEAKTNAFMLATATVMVGPVANLFQLTEAEHSIGLVKNFQITAEPTYTELTQGVKNNIVYSVMTQNPVKASMEVYEFTAKNLAYGLGLDGSSLQEMNDNFVLEAKITGGEAAVSAVLASETDISAQFAEGQWFYIQDGGSDRVHITRVGTATYSAEDKELTITFDHAVPTGLEFPAGSRLRRVNRIDVGSKEEQPYLAAKIVGILPDGNKPITLLIPKLRITKGFTLAFQSDNFGNLPFEFTPYDLVSTDAHYALFRDRGPVAIFK